MARVRPMSLTALVMAVSALFVAGCFGPKPNQTNVPPPPLVKPKGEYRDKVYALVPVTTGDPAPLVDLRLAGPNNGLGRALYDEAEAYLRQQTLDLLSRAQQAAAREQWALVVLDAARSERAQRALAALVADDRFVKVPAQGDGCPETRGAAVDVTLVDMSLNGEELDMGSQYMEIGSASLAAADGVDKDALLNRAKLHDLMVRVGFEPGGAWWQYTDPNWRDYPEVAEADYPHKLSASAEEVLERARTTRPESAPPDYRAH